LLSVNKEGAVTAADIQVNQNVELVNPDAAHLHARQEEKVEMELTVKVGRGFCQSDENKKPGQAIGVVAIDSCSPRSRACVTPWKPPASATARTTTVWSWKSGPTAASRPTTR
jgi:hypothetical protein